MPWIQFPKQPYLGALIDDLEDTHHSPMCFHDDESSCLHKKKSFFKKNSHWGKSEVQSQSSTIRVQLLRSVRPFLFRRDFSKVSAKYFRQRNPAVKIPVTFAQLFYMWVYFYLHFTPGQFLGERSRSAPPSLPLLGLLRNDSLSLILMGTSVLHHSTPLTNLHS